MITGRNLNCAETNMSLIRNCYLKQLISPCDCELENKKKSTESTTLAEILSVALATSTVQTKLIWKSGKRTRRTLFTQIDSRNVTESMCNNTLQIHLSHSWESHESHTIWSDVNHFIALRTQVLCSCEIRAPVHSRHTLVFKRRKGKQQSNTKQL